MQIDPSVLNNPPEDSPPDDKAPNIGAEEPKRRGRPPGSKNGSGSTNRKPSWPNAGAVEVHLTEMVNMAGTALIFVNAEDSRIILQGGPRIVHELVELAKTEPALRRYLEMSAAPGKYGPLTLAILGVMIPVMVNHNLIPTIPMFSA